MTDGRLEKAGRALDSICIGQGCHPRRVRKRATWSEHVYNGDRDPSHGPTRNRLRREDAPEHRRSPDPRSRLFVTNPTLMSPPAPILPTLQGPADLRDLTAAQLDQLAAEIRETIIST